MEWLIDLATRMRAMDSEDWTEAMALFDGAVLQTADGEVVAMRVPIAARLTGSPAVRFLDALEALTQVLGPASVMGSYGDPGPFYESGPRWGNPFARWRGRSRSLELQAIEDGPELVLQATVPVDNWFWRQGHGEPYAIGGFFGHRLSPENEGLSIPGQWTTSDWDVFTRALGDFLTTLPAETLALNIGLSFGIHAMIPSTGGPTVVDLYCVDGQLEIALIDVPGLEALPLAGLGWISADDVPMVADHYLDTRWHTGVHGPDRVPGRRLAETLVGTLRALGVASPRDLALSDHAQKVKSYRVVYFGLTLEEFR